MKSKSIPRLSIIALACAGSAHAADISFSSSTPLTLSDTQSYENGTVDRIGSGTGTIVTFASGANYTFSGNLTLTGAWNRITLNTGGSLTVNGTLSADVSGVSLNGGTLTAGALRLGDNPNFVGTLSDGKQTVEWGDSVINGSTVIASQSNANFISLNNDSGFASNNLLLNGDGATFDTNGFNIGGTMAMVGSGGLIKTGSGTLSLTAGNTFTGNTTVTNGVLEVTSTGKLYGGGYTASPVITVDTGATLRLNGWSWDAAGSIANLDFGRTRLVVNGGTLEYTGASNFNPGDPGSSSRNLTIGTGGATLKASSTAGQIWTISSGNGNLVNDTGLTLDGAGAGEIQNLIEGSGTVTKSGAGTWTLSGANTYTGTTTVTGGTLSLTSPSLDNASSVIIGTTPGATMNLNFTGNDIIGGLQINGSAPLAPGAYNASHPTYGSYFTGSGTLLVVTGASGTWTSLADGVWEEPTNWASNTIATGFNQTATFNAASGVTVTLSGNQTIGNLTFDVSDYTLSGAGAITLDAGGKPAISVGGGRSATLSANIAGTLGFEKTGAGTLVLSGLKSYTGETIVTGGTLEVSGGTVGNAQIHDSLTVNTGATVAFTNGDGTGFGFYNSPVTSVTVNGGTIDAVSGSHLGFGLYATMTLQNGGTLQGTWQWNGDTLLGFSSTGNSTNTISGSVELRPDAGVNHTFLVDDGSATTDLQIDANLLDSTFGDSNLVKNGAGTMVLNGSNTYDGNTVIAGGALNVSASSNLRFRPTTNGTTNKVSGSGSGALSFLGTVDLALSAANTTNGNAWNLFNLASFSAPPSLSNIAGVSSNLGAFTEVSAGTWELPVTNAKWVFTEADGNLTYIVTATDYDTWASSFSLAEGPTGDDDKDGLTNEKEYAFGLIPNSGSSVNPIVVPFNKATGTFSYTRRATPTSTGLAYTIWTSTNLGSWVQDSGASEGIITTSGQVETVPVTISSALLTNPKLFIQVRAE